MLCLDKAMKNVIATNAYYILALFFSIIIWTMGSSTVWATPVLDQIYFDPVVNFSGSPSTNGGSGTPGFRRAQTFTVGIGGLLNSVDNMTMFFPSGGSMRILATIGGAPTFTVLATSIRLFHSADFLWNIWDFSSSGLFVTPGEVLAMDMLALEDELWLGHQPGGYNGGADYFANPIFGFPNFTPNPSGADSFFRTFVGEGSRIPECPSLMLLAVEFTGYFLMIRLREMGQRKAAGKSQR
jgi:hypothetical protein